MEHFYRRMRKRFGYLMESENKPEGGQWNFDAENRNKLKAPDLLLLPTPLRFDNSISSIKSRLERHNVKSIGNVGESLLWPINRAQALSLLAHFCQCALPNFGRFQDAMTAQHPYRWSLYHSRLSFALNCKLLSPQEVIGAAIDAYRAAQGEVSLAQVEGFVRQILGGESTYAVCIGATCLITKLAIILVLGALCRVISGMVKRRCTACNKRSRILGFWLCAPYSTIDGNRQLCPAHRM